MSEILHNNTSENWKKEIIADSHLTKTEAEIIKQQYEKNKNDLISVTKGELKDFIISDYGEANRQYLGGSEGIKTLQEKLKQAGSEITIDGIFGPETFLALIEFQKKNGLIPDGIAGTETQSKIQMIARRIETRIKPNLVPGKRQIIALDTLSNDPRPLDQKIYKSLEIKIQGIEETIRIIQSGRKENTGIVGGIGDAFIEAAKWTGITQEKTGKEIYEQQMEGARRQAHMLAEDIIKQYGGANLLPADKEKIETILQKLEKLSETKLGTISWGKATFNSLGIDDVSGDAGTLKNRSKIFARTVIGTAEGAVDGIVGIAELSGKAIGILGAYVDGDTRELVKQDIDSLFSQLTYENAKKAIALLPKAIEAFSNLSVDEQADGFGKFFGNFLIAAGIGVKVIQGAKYSLKLGGRAMRMAKHKGTIAAIPLALAGTGQAVAGAAALPTGVAIRIGEVDILPGRQAKKLHARKHPTITDATMIDARKINPGDTQGGIVLTRGEVGSTINTQIRLLTQINNHKLQSITTTLLAGLQSHSTNPKEIINAIDKAMGSYLLLLPTLKTKGEKKALETALTILEGEKGKLYNIHITDNGTEVHIPDSQLGKGVGKGKNQPAADIVDAQSKEPLKQLGYEPMNMNPHQGVQPNTIRSDLFPVPSNTHPQSPLQIEYTLSRTIERGIQDGIQGVKKKQFDNLLNPENYEAKIQELRVKRDHEEISQKQYREGQVNLITERALQVTNEIFLEGERILRSNPEIQRDILMQNLQDYLSKNGIRISGVQKDIIDELCNAFESACKTRTKELKKIFEGAKTQMPEKLEDIERMMNENPNVNFLIYLDGLIKKAIGNQDQEAIQNLITNTGIEGVRQKYLKLSPEDKPRIDILSHPTVIIYDIPENIWPTGNQIGYFDGISISIRRGSDDIGGTIEHEYIHFLNSIGNNAIARVKEKIIQSGKSNVDTQIDRLGYQVVPESSMDSVGKIWKTMQDELIAHIKANNEVPLDISPYLNGGQKIKLENGEIPQETIRKIAIIGSFIGYSKETVGINSDALVDIIRTSRSMEEAYLRIRNTFAKELHGSPATLDEFENSFIQSLIDSEKTGAPAEKALTAFEQASANAGEAEVRSNTFFQNLADHPAEQPTETQLPSWISSTDTATETQLPSWISSTNTAKKGPDRTVSQDNGTVLHGNPITTPTHQTNTPAGARARESGNIEGSSIDFTELLGEKKHRIGGIERYDNVDITRDKNGTIGVFRYKNTQTQDTLYFFIKDGELTSTGRYGHVSFDNNGDIQFTTAQGKTGVIPKNFVSLEAGEAEVRSNAFFQNLADHPAEQPNKTQLPSWLSSTDTATETQGISWLSPTNTATETQGISWLSPTNTAKKGPDRTVSQDNGTVLHGNPVINQNPVEGSSIDFTELLGEKKHRIGGIERYDNVDITRDKNGTIGVFRYKNTQTQDTLYFFIKDGELTSTGRYGHVSFDNNGDIQFTTAQGKTGVIPRNFISLELPVANPTVPRKAPVDDSPDGTIQRKIDERWDKGRNRIPFPEDIAQIFGDPTRLTSKSGAQIYSKGAMLTRDENGTIRNFQYTDTETGNGGLTFTLREGKIKNILTGQAVVKPNGDIQFTTAQGKTGVIPKNFVSLE